MDRIKINYEPTLRANLDKSHVEHIEEIAEQRGISRAALIRKWLAAGERAEQTIIPKFEDDTTPSVYKDPIKQLFYDVLPENKDEAVSIDEIREEMKNQIEGEVVKFVRELEDIDMTDEGRIYEQ